MTWNLALLVIALGLSILSIALRYWETPPEIIRRVTRLEVDLQESIDTTARWLKRENVRRARDAKEDQPVSDPIQIPGVDHARKKAMLRERARVKGLM